MTETYRVRWKNHAPTWSIRTPLGIVAPTNHHSSDWEQWGRYNSTCFPKYGCVWESGFPPKKKLHSMGKLWLTNHISQVLYFFRHLEWPWRTNMGYLQRASHLAQDWSEEVGCQFSMARLKAVGIHLNSGCFSDCIIESLLWTILIKFHLPHLSSIVTGCPPRHGLPWGLTAWTCLQGMETSGNTNHIEVAYKHGKVSITGSVYGFPGSLSMCVFHQEKDSPELLA